MYSVCSETNSIYFVSLHRNRGVFMDYKRKLKEGLFTFATLCFMYILNILTQDIFYTKVEVNYNDLLH